MIKWVNKIFKILTVVALSIFVLLPLLIYILFNLPPVQRFATAETQRQLSGLLGVPVKIGSVDIALFNKVFVDDVIVTDPLSTDTILTVKRLGAGVRIGRLLYDHRLVFSFAEIINPDIRLWKDSIDTPLNIQPIIDRLSSKDKDYKPKAFDLTINSVVIRGGRFSYDVVSEPALDTQNFNPHHVHLNGIKADILIPRLSNGEISVHIKRLALSDSSDIDISDMEANISVSDTLAIISPLTIATPRSSISIPNLSAKYSSIKSILSNPLSANIAIDSINLHVNTSDISVFLNRPLPFTKELDIDIATSISCDNEKLHLIGLSIKETANALAIDIPEIIVDNYLKPDSIAVAADDIVIKINPRQIPVSDIHLSKILAGIDPVKANARLNLDMQSRCQSSINLSSASGNITAEATASAISRNSISNLSATLIAKDLDLGKILGNQKLGLVNAVANINGNISENRQDGNADVDIVDLYYNGYTYRDIKLSAIADKTDIDINMQSSDDNAMLDVVATVSGLNTPRQSLRSKSEVFRLLPDALNLTNRYPGKILSGRVDIALQGEDLHNLNGRIEVDNFQFADTTANGIAIDHFSFLSGGNTTNRYAIIHSDILDGKIEGQYDVTELPGAFRAVMAAVLPNLFLQYEPKEASQQNDCNLSLNLTLRENSTTNNLLKFFKSPISILYPATLKVDFSRAEQELTASLDAPYLMQKDKFIDNTSLNLSVDGHAGQILLNATTTMPTKHGPTDLSLDLNSIDGVADIGVSWNVDNKHKYKGLLSLTTKVAKNDENKFYADIDINPTTAVINDTIWSIRPAEITYNADILTIDNFEVSQGNQYIRLDGTASINPMDCITLQLKEIDLDYVFESLDIPTAMFGGTATGDFFASEIFSKTPVIYTPRLYVRDMTYNSALLGDASISSTWDPQTLGITLDADIVADNRRHNYVTGAIYPTKSSLDFNFTTDSINIAFLRPFMSAFTSDVSGHASGNAHLYGTFSDINLTGDVLAQNFTLKIDYTNTFYHVTDSVHIEPGRIEFNDITITDDYGNKAKFNGFLGHNYFHNPWFEFRLSDARNFLCYDITPRINPDWYGRVFCNGSAFVKGVPGFIDLNINVSTAANSTFTFVLSDTEAASEYTFLEFRDRNAISSDLLLSVENPSSASVKRLKEYYTEQRRKANQSQATRYHINLQVDPTPAAEMILVMDPVGGDRIKARGSGNIRMDYNSSDEELAMYGKYELTQGTYNFTLQDIIIKDFTIKPGSTITFNGDPMNAGLNIEATYAVNANLSDLDESFLQDKDLNRTNVPVHALLKITGDVHHPDLNFDLEFPTLTQDTYRKVRSIVSTEDMMNRQILYLLALNRFYTPDYMNGNTKGNELVSVASSTLSSQLSNILGQISDNWTIAPNFRSDRGDFTDMEVDLALSSHLLNNRLLFNGNLGYRDKTLNTNTFVGDFDIEYLLNKSGSLRLKAYNRYNDQNYFVKSALTTQGVGIVYKKSFDNMFDFLRRKNKTTEKLVETPAAPISDELLQFSPKPNSEN